MSSDCEAVLGGVRVLVYHPEDAPDVISVQIDTDVSGQRVRVMLNDGDLFIGDPEKDEQTLDEIDRMRRRDTRNE